MQQKALLESQEIRGGTDRLYRLVFFRLFLALISPVPSPLPPPPANSIPPPCCCRRSHELDLSFSSDDKAFVTAESAREKNVFFVHH